MAHILVVDGRPMNREVPVSLIKQSTDAPKTVVVTLLNSAACRSAARTAGAGGFIAKGDFVADLPPLPESLFPGRRA